MAWDFAVDDFRKDTWFVHECIVAGLYNLLKSSSNKRSIEVMERQKNYEHDSRVKRVGRRLGLTAAYGAGFLPMAAFLGIANASVDDYFGPNEATYETTVDSSSVFDFGWWGEAEAPISFGPFSADVTVHGIPGDGRQDQAHFISNAVDQYALQYKLRDEYADTITERLKDDALQKTLYYELSWVGAVAIGSRVLKRNVRETVSPLYVAGLSTCLLAGALATSTYESQDVSPQYPIAGAPNVTTDSPTLLFTLNRLVPSIQNFVDRSEKRSNEFASSAIAQLEQHAPLMQEREEDEVIVVAYSDMHCSFTQIKVLKAISSIYQPALTLNAGDAVTNGLAIEKECVEAEADATEAKTAYSPGNHDSTETESQARNADMVVLDGKTTEINGFDVLGDNDPERTPAFGSGADTRYSETGETEEELGARLHDEAEDNTPDIVVVHQPDAANAFLAEPIPAGVKLIVRGHTHHLEDPDTYYDTDGGPVTSQQLGTAGGIGEQRFDSLSTPLSTPTRDATYVAYRWSTTLNQPIAEQITTVTPNGEVSVSEWIRLAVPSIIQQNLFTSAAEKRKKTP